MKNDYFTELLNVTGSKINFGYRIYDLHIKSGLTSEGEKCLGLADYDNGVISLDNKQSPLTAKETIIHEMLHVLCEFCGLGGAEADGLVRQIPNEELVTSVSRGFLLLMELNRPLFHFLLTNPYNERPTSP